MLKNLKAFLRFIGRLPSSAHRISFLNLRIPIPFTVFHVQGNGFWRTYFLPTIENISEMDLMPSYIRHFLKIKSRVFITTVGICIQQSMFIHFIKNIGHARFRKLFPRKFVFLGASEPFFSVILLYEFIKLEFSVHESCLENSI